MCPRLVNSSLALHTDEQHRIVHAHLVNILKSSLMKNQSSIINHPRSDLIRDNLGVPFCLNPFVVVWVVLSFWPVWFYSFLIRADVCPSVTLSSFFMLGLECLWLQDHLFPVLRWHRMWHNCDSWQGLLMLTKGGSNKWSFPKFMGTVCTGSL